MCAKPLQLWPTLYNLTDHSLPGSSIHGILQARTLECVVISSPKGSSWPRDWTHVSCHLLHWQVGSLPLVPPWKSKTSGVGTSKCSYSRACKCWAQAWRGGYVLSGNWRSWWPDIWKPAGCWTFPRCLTPGDFTFLRNGFHTQREGWVHHLIIVLARQNSVKQ